MKALCTVNNFFIELLHLEMGDGTNVCFVACVSFVKEIKRICRFGLIIHVILSEEKSSHLMVQLDALACSFD